MSVDRHREALAARLAPRLSPQAGEWLDERRREIETDPSALARAFPGVGRRTGRGWLLDPPPAGPVRLHGGLGPILNPWRLDEAARVFLLLEEARRDPAGVVARAVSLYFDGAAGERVAVLRALQLLPGTEAGLPAICDALRANALDLFAAAICENTCASHHLPDEVFFQAVLKCVFVGLRVDRIERVEERTTPELARMLFAYVTEREHAGRPVPVELWPLVARFPPPGAIERIRVHRAHAKDPYERGILQRALGRAERQ
jgi:hypothetical protein